MTVAVVGVALPFGLGFAVCHALGLPTIPSIVAGARIDCDLDRNFGANTFRSRPARTPVKDRSFSEQQLSMMSLASSFFSSCRQWSEELHPHG
jgi:hypothetical protein